MDGVRMVTKGRRGGNENVIHIDNDAGSLRQEAKLDVLEDLIHHCLECTWGISQSKEHNPWFKKAVFGFEGCLFFVPRFDPNIVITPSHVKLGKDICILYLTDEIGNERQGVPISNSEFVQPSVVLYRPEFAVFLLYKEERGCVRGF